MNVNVEHKCEITSVTLTLSHVEAFKLAALIGLTKQKNKIPCEELHRFYSDLFHLLNDRMSLHNSVMTDQDEYQKYENLTATHITLADR